MNFEQYINPELLILIPVLYFIAEAIKKTDIRDKFIPLILGIASIIICSVYVLANNEIIGQRAVATAIFTAITQGILIAGTTVYANQLVKQTKEVE